MSGPISAIIAIGTMASMVKTTKNSIKNKEMSKVSLSSTVKLIEEQLNQFRRNDEEIYRLFANNGILKGIKNESTVTTSSVAIENHDITAIDIDFNDPTEVQKSQEKFYETFIQLLEEEQKAAEEEFKRDQNVKNLRFKYQQLKNDIKDSLSSLVIKASSIDQFAKQCGLTTESLTVADNLKKSFVALPEDFENMTDLSVMEDKYQEINLLAQSVDEQDIYLSNEFQRLKEKFNSTQTENILSKVSVYSATKLAPKSLSEQESSKSRDEQKLTAEEKLCSLSIIDECSFWVKSEELKIQISKAQEQLDKCIDRESIRSFRQLTLNPLLKKCKDDNEAYLEAREQYFLIWPQYQVLCQYLNLSAEKFDDTPIGVAALKDAIETLENKLLVRERNASVSNVIDEVMEQLGYNLIGKKSFVSRRGDQIDQKLMEFSDNTAIHVTETENGQITMEIVGTSDNDRQATPNEKKLLKNEMVSFCKKFPEIRQALAEKGIELNNVAEFPADEQFAKILGLESYDTSMRKDSHISYTEETKRRYLDQ